MTLLPDKNPMEDKENTRQESHGDEKRQRGIEEIC